MPTHGAAGPSPVPKMVKRSWQTLELQLWPGVNSTALPRDGGRRTGLVTSKSMYRAASLKMMLGACCYVETESAKAKDRLREVQSHSRQSMVGQRMHDVLCLRLNLSVKGPKMRATVEVHCRLLGCSSTTTAICTHFLGALVLP